MKDGWQIVLNEASVHFLLGLRTGHRQQLLKAFEALAADPTQKGNFEGKDITGRIIQTKVSGAFLISFWPDHFVKELRIVRLERI